MKKLASIQKITKIEPIKKEETYEIAHVSNLGWPIIVKKNEYKAGDIVVFFHLDAFLPIEPRYESLRPTSYRKNSVMGEGFKIRTMKIGSYLNQGHIMHLSEFPELSQQDIFLGTDVTCFLQVKEWKLPKMSQPEGTILGDLPVSIPSTKEVNYQDYPQLQQEFKGKLLNYYITTMVDGSPHSISIDKHGFHVANDVHELKNDGTNLFYNLVNERNYCVLMEDYFMQNGLTSFTIQGDLCGPDIHRNRMKLPKHEWYVFNILLDAKRVGVSRLIEICDLFGMTHVKIEEENRDMPFRYPKLESLLKRCMGNYSGGNKKQGVIVRPAEPIYSPILGNYLSMKVVNNQYLLQEEYIHNEI